MESNNFFLQPSELSAAIEGRVVEKTSDAIADEFLGLMGFGKTLGAPQQLKLLQSEITVQSYNADLPDIPQKINLAPSSLGWLDCHRCIFLEIRLGIKRPSGGFPSIFNAIDRAQSDAFLGAHTSDIHPELPPGEIVAAQRWLKVDPPICIDGIDISMKGPCDLLVKLDSGEYMILDFKTANPEKHPIAQYSLQQDTYCIAANLAGMKTRKYGLIYFQPNRYAKLRTDKISHGLSGSVEVRIKEHDRNNVIGTLEQFIKIASNSSIPDADENCNFCNYAGKINPFL